MNETITKAKDLKKTKTKSKSSLECNILKDKKPNSIF